MAWEAWQRKWIQISHTVKLHCGCKLVLDFKGTGCRHTGLDSLHCLQKQLEVFYIWLLDFVLAYPSLPGQIPFKALWSSHEKLLSGLFSLPRCDGVDWVPPVSSTLCHLLTASRWVTKLFHRRERQSLIYILIKFVTHPCSCPGGCHLSMFLCFWITLVTCYTLWHNHMCKAPLKHTLHDLNGLTILLVGLIPCWPFL